MRRSLIVPYGCYTAQPEIPLGSVSLGGRKGKSLWSENLTFLMSMQRTVGLEKGLFRNAAEKIRAGDRRANEVQLRGKTWKTGNEMQRDVRGDARRLLVPEVKESWAALKQLSPHLSCGTDVLTLGCLPIDMVNWGPIWSALWQPASTDPVRAEYSRGVITTHVRATKKERERNVLRVRKPAAEGEAR